MEVQKQKILEALADKYCGFFYESEQSDYIELPCTPIAYWTSQQLLSDFKNGTLLGELAKPRQGMATTNNNLFLRLWHEVNSADMYLHAKNKEEALNSKCKWFPYNKGGDYRKWYGNNDYLVNWKDDGADIKRYLIGKNPNIPRGESLYFKECFSWSLISSAEPAFRYKAPGNIFDIAGMSCFSDDKLFYLLALCNSKVALSILHILAPTINFQAGDIANIPVLIDLCQEQRVTEIAKTNIRLSKYDWDSFENSWDFNKSPLLCYKSNKISVAYEMWSKECAERFNMLKSNEEELNRIFIDIYGLQDELTPKVEDKDVTVRKADLQRDIKDLISYAVGCIFGRYSLEIDGLAYAGGEWDDSKYENFIPDEDNCIPITDEEYFSNDIVGRFVEFIKTVYGSETLEENLEFIANALGNKSDTARDVIRNYFLNNFYADHLKVYQKRPIYWLFDSGKQNGFKALIYMHRYDADTVGRVRTDYLHKAQKYVETAMQSAQYTIDNATAASDKSKATKAVTKYTKQLAEMKIYDEAIAHVANQRIEIDLDDGVKVNYAKFQGIEVAQEGKKSIKVDLLAKI